MILLHIIVYGVFVWYIMMLRRIRAFRQDVNALFSGYDAPPTHDYSAIKVVQDH